MDIIDVFILLLRDKWPNLHVRRAPMAVSSITLWLTLPSYGSRRKATSTIATLEFGNGNVTIKTPRITHDRFHSVHLNSFSLAHPKCIPMIMETLSRYIEGINYAIAHESNRYDRLQLLVTAVADRMHPDLINAPTRKK